jgi:transposase InsO family protein
VLPQGPNQRWSLDFLHDQMSDGRRFRILAIVDDFTRECLCLVADTSLSGLRVGRELDAIIARRGKPAGCVSDNGTSRLRRQRNSQRKRTEDEPYPVPIEGTGEAVPVNVNSAC